MPDSRIWTGSVLSSTQAARDVLERFARLDVLANSAGIGQRSALVIAGITSNVFRHDEVAQEVIGVSCRASAPDFKELIG